MRLGPGDHLGPYEIVSAIGAGGMGEVYRARDRKLNRDVALKVLPSDFALDPDRLARFKREAQLLASLNHPNIAAIYGFEDSGNTHALVLELVEGDTVADRIARGPISWDEALPIARQICEALEAAHDQGIVHRDLKPANIKLRPDGTVKVLDFGLAKALDPSPTSSLSISPTITSPAMMTGAGVMLGTAAYMSPEQARGKAVDTRADIWAFGCVLFELVTGHPAFDGETVSDVLAKILEREPDWSRIAPTTPPGVVRLLRRCLQKDPRQRLHHIADARLDIEEPSEAIVRARQLVPRSTVPWVVVAIIAVAAAVPWMRGARQPPSTIASPVHLQLVLPPGIRVAVETDHPALVLSPDGRRVVFVGDDRGTRRLYVRDLDKPDTRTLSGTEGAAAPFFSPDGAWIGFFDGFTLKRVSPSSGVPVSVHAVTGTTVNHGATWLSGDTVIVAMSANSGLSSGSVAAETIRPFSEWKLVTKAADSYTWWPEALPGGLDLLFSDHRAGRQDEARVSHLALQTGETKSLINGGTNPRYSPTGHILFARGGALYAVPFDATSATATGVEQKLIDGVMTQFNGSAQFTVAANGTLAYIAGSAEPLTHELVWVNREGAIATFFDNGRAFADPRLSPDGTRLAVTSADGPNSDIWVLDIVRRTLTRITSDPGEDFGPVWSPDGKRLVFASEIGGDGPGLAWIAAPGDRPAQLLRRPGASSWEFPSSWSRDGQWIAFTATQADISGDIEFLPTDETRAPRAYLQTPSNEMAGMFSPDGRSIAYVSNDSGRAEVYVRSVSDPGDRVQVSANGGVEPLWSRDGREIFYREGDRLMVVKAKAGPTFEASLPQFLFEGRFEKAQSGAFTAQYDVTPDGRRFVMVRRKNLVTVTVIDVVLNWPAAFHVAASLPAQ